MAKKELTRKFEYNDPLLFDVNEHKEVVVNHVSMCIPGLERSVKDCIIASMQGIAYSDNGLHLYENTETPQMYSRPFADKLDVMQEQLEQEQRITDAQRNEKNMRQKLSEHENSKEAISRSQNSAENESKADANERSEAKDNALK